MNIQRRNLVLLGGDEVQTLVKFVNLPSPHPLPPLPWGEGGRGPGEGSAALGDPTLGGKRLLATSSVLICVVCLVCEDFILSRALTRLVGGKPSKSRSKSASTTGNEIRHRISEMADLVAQTSLGPFRFTHESAVQEEYRPGPLTVTSLYDNVCDHADTADQDPR